MYNFLPRSGKSIDDEGKGRLSFRKGGGLRWEGRSSPLPRHQTKMMYLLVFGDSSWKRRCQGSAARPHVAGKKTGKGEIDTTGLSLRNASQLGTPRFMAKSWSGAYWIEQTPLDRGKGGEAEKGETMEIVT